MLWPTYANITSKTSQHPLEMRAAPRGTLDLARANGVPGSTPTGSAEAVLNEWFQRAAAYLTQRASPGP